MSVDEVADWKCAVEGEECLTRQMYSRTVEWVRALAGSDDFRAEVRDMLVEAFSEGVETPFGLVDDMLMSVRPWGFDLVDVACPTTVLWARHDDVNPPAHGQWLVAHLPDAISLPVGGDHFGPRDEPEEELLGWLAFSGSAG